MKQFDEQKMVNMSDEELLGFIGGLDCNNKVTT